MLLRRYHKPTSEEVATNEVVETINTVDDVVEGAPEEVVEETKPTRGRKSSKKVADE